MKIASINRKDLQKEVDALSPMDFWILKCAA